MEQRNYGKEAELQHETREGKEGEKKGRMKHRTNEHTREKQENERTTVTVDTL